MTPVAPALAPRPVSRRAARVVEEASHAVPECFATNHYRDRTHDIDAVKILPGEYYATPREMLIVTVLGSCVAACIRDPERGIGGMNHFMLPDSDNAGETGRAARYGSFAMEMLINHLIKLGAKKERLVAKVFGGGNVIAAMTHANVGHRNAQFVQEFLRDEGIRIVARDLARDHARKVYFFSASGRVMLKRLRDLKNNTILERETDYRGRVEVTGDAGGEVELFT